MGKNFEEEAVLKREQRKLYFRNEPFTIVYHFYIDGLGEDSAYTTIELDELNMAQVYNQYRFKNGIPFVDEIKSIREQYGLSASKMSEILGLGPNVYRNYENGEMPSPATGRLIQLIKDPSEFRKLIEYSKHKLEEADVEKITKKVEAQLGAWDPMDKLYEQHLFGEVTPNIFTGFRVPTIEKVGNLVKYFSHKLCPFTTKMNKLLFYADFLHYRRRGYSISGLTYKAITHGPVPNNYGFLYDKLHEEGYIEKEIVSYGEQVEGERFISNDAAVEMKLFEDSEIRAINDVIKTMGSLSTSHIIQVSHREDAWKNNVDERHRVNYQYSFLLKTIN